MEGQQGVYSRCRNVEHLSLGPQEDSFEQFASRSSSMQRRAASIVAPTRIATLARELALLRSFPASKWQEGTGIRFRLCLGGDS